MCLQGQAAAEFFNVIFHFFEHRERNAIHLLYIGVSAEISETHLKPGQMETAR